MRWWRRFQPEAIGLIALLLQPAFAQQKLTIVQYVQATTQAGEFAAAENALGQYRKALGQTPEYLDALSWVGRGQLAKHNYEAAEKNAEDVRAKCLAEL